MCVKRADNLLLYFETSAIYSCIIPSERGLVDVGMLGERLRDLREEFNYDQKDLGRKLHITASAYGYYEQERNEPPLETLVKIAEIYNVSTDYLLGLSDIRDSPAEYATTKKLLLTDKEQQVVEQLKRTSLLQELSEDPKNNVERLKRYWEFLEQERDRK